MITIQSGLNDKKLFIKLFKNLLLLIIIFWIILAVLRTFYNLYKIPTEERTWIQMSEDDKRVNLYGDVEYLFIKTNKITKENDCVLLYSSSDKSFFLLRYILYPKKVYWANRNDEALMPKEKVCNFAIIYNVKANANIESILNISQPFRKIAEIPSSSFHENKTLIFRSE